MGILDIFKSEGGEQEAKKMPWNPLTEVSALDQIAEDSKSKLQVIFKHSTRCGISKMAMKQFEAEFDYEGKIVAHYLDLLNYREVSNAIAEKFDVVHQSPQIVVLKDGEAVHHASQDSISAKAIAAYI